MKPREFWIEMSKYDEPRTVWTDEEMSRFLEAEDILGLQKRSIKVIEYSAYKELQRKLKVYEDLMPEILERLKTYSINSHIGSPSEKVYWKVINSLKAIEGREEINK